MTLLWIHRLLALSFAMNCASISLASQEQSPSKKDVSVSELSERQLFLPKGAIMPPLANKSVSAGAGVTFRCRVVRKSSSYKIRWKKNGANVPQSGRVKITRQDWGSRLRIRGARPADAGMYQCVVKNRNGQKFTSLAWLDVKDRRSKERCEVYSGSVCKGYVSSFVAFSSGKQQHVIEKEIREMANYQDKLKGRCRKTLMPFLCLYFFPPCGSKYVCREHCQILEKKTCRKTLKNIRPFRQIWNKLIYCDKLPSNARGQKATCLIPGSSPPTSNGTCKAYTGSKCLDHITPGSQVFTTSSRSQSESEEDLGRTLQLFNHYTSPSCAKVVKKALCHNLFPACRNYGFSRPQLLCRNDCDMLYTRSCSKEFALLRNLEEAKRTVVQRILPNCSALPFKEENNCLKLGLIANKTQDLRGRTVCASYLTNQRAAEKTTATRIKSWNGRQEICGGKPMTNMSGILNLEASRLIREITDDFAKGQLFFSQNETRIRYCLKVKFNFAGLVKNWDNFDQGLRLPNLEVVLDIGELPGLEITLVKSELESVNIPLGSAVSYQVHERIQLKNVTFFYRYLSGRGGSVIARGSYDLCETPFTLTVEKLNDGTVRASGVSSAPLDVDTIERVFVFARPSVYILDAVKRSSLFVARLMRPRMEAYIGKHFSVKFSGDSYLGEEATPIHLEFYCRKLRGCDFTAGVTSSKVSFSEVLEIFTGFQFPSLDLFNQDSNDSRVGVSLSTTSVNITHRPNLQFVQKPLSTAFGHTIPEGLSFSSRNMIPRFCADKQLCQLMQLVFGAGCKFTTSASTRNSNVHLTAKFDELKAPFDRAELTMKIDTGRHMYPGFASIVNHAISVDGNIFGTGQHPKAWPFSGHLNYDASKSSLQGSFATKASWNKAFGVEHLTIKNTNVGIFLVPTHSSYDNRVSGKADFEYGVGCSPKISTNTSRDNCITGDATFGFSDDPTQHYFHGTVHPVDLKKLISASGFNLQLPGALATSGFPRGLQVSIAKRDHDLRGEHDGLVLPAGFTLKGKMRILGILTDVSIFLESTDFLIDARVGADDSKTEDSADLSSLPSDEPQASPAFVLKTRVNSSLFTQTDIDGYVRLLGVFDEMRMSMTRDALQLSMVTSINKSLQVSLHLDTNYSNHVNKTHFTTKIIFQNGLTKLTRLVSKHVIRLLEVEMSRMKSTEMEVRRLRKECHASVKRECDKCVSDVACEASLSDCHEKMNQRRQDKPPLKGITPNDLCQTIVHKGCQQTNNSCHATCHAISSRANETCWPLGVAVQAQRDLERDLKWVHDANTYIDRNLFKIHGITFEATLGADTIDQVSVEMTMEVTVFGKKHSLTGLKLSFQEFAKLASEIAKHAVDWYQTSQPDSKVRHPDNRPRSSAS